MSGRLIKFYPRDDLGYGYIKLVAIRIIIFRCKLYTALLLLLITAIHRSAYNHWSLDDPNTNSTRIYETIIFG